MSQRTRWALGAVSALGIITGGMVYLGIRQRHNEDRERTEMLARARTYQDTLAVLTYFEAREARRAAEAAEARAGSSTR
jgi:hypothetical protein